MKLPLALALSCLVPLAACGGKVQLDPSDAPSAARPDASIPDSSAPDGAAVDSHVEAATEAGDCPPLPGPMDCWDECTQQMYAPECVGGQWRCTHEYPNGCPGDCCPGDADCVDPCTGEMYGPTCVNGQCICSHEYPNGCPDAAVDAPPDVNPDECLFMAEDPACDACFKANCLVQCVDCSLNAACTDLLMCYYECGSTPDCLQQCHMQHPDGVSDYEAFIGQQGCVAASCIAECGPM